MKNKYSKMFKAGNKAQLEQMVKNDHKKGWDNTHMSWAIKKIGEHLPEMNITTFYKRPVSSYVRLRKLAADVANLAQMIILRCDKIISEEAENQNDS